MTEGKASDVHSGGHIDGDGEVVGRHFEGERAIRQDMQLCLLVVEGKKNRRRGTNTIVFLGGVVLLLVRMMVLMLMKSMVTMLKLD